MGIKSGNRETRLLPLFKGKVIVFYTRKIAEVMGGGAVKVDGFDIFGW